LKTVRLKPVARSAPSPELARLRVRLAESEATLQAIRTGGVDTVVVAGRQGPQIFTLQGAEHAYRALIESMNEGALTLTADAVILYANTCFARMVKRPLEQVIGSSFRQFLSAPDRALLRPLLKQAGTSGSKIQVRLNAGDSGPLPAQISIRPLARIGGQCAAVGLVVTDMTEARRTEELMRALTHRVVQVQETERAGVALELHDHITQLLCAILFRCQALVDELSARAGPSLKEAVRLREMLTQTAGEVERITRNLRPGVLEQLGLVAVLRATSLEFADRTGVNVELACKPLTKPLPAATELALYRILQQALKNVEQHARARQVTVSLTQPGAFAQLTILDDGIGFDANRPAAKRKGKEVLGLLAMRERAAYAGGVLTIKSGRRAGTEIEVRIPLSTAAH
jgi:PAS domain S-box-containing protein